MIVVGTDFSENALQATRAAAAIAKRLKAPLKLVHVFDERSAELLGPQNRGSVDATLRQRLAERAAEAAKQFGIEVEPVLVLGVPHQKLAEVATQHQARLLVVSALGEGSEHRWLLGSVAERVAQTSPLPVLIVRDGASLEEWMDGNRVLRTMVGVEIGPTSKAALRFAAELRGWGRCDLLVTQVAWPFAEHARLGIPVPIPLDHLRPELHELLLRDLRTWAADVPGVAGEGEATFTVSPGLGRIDTHLALLAEDAKADLLVVGTHQRAGSARLWQGSVSRGVLHYASCNVLCVPLSAYKDEGIVPTFRRVLIPTDFSPLANRAIPAGYGLVAPGGIVHLVYAMTRKHGEDESKVLERLRALIPPGAVAKGVTTEVEVVHDESAWSGIWHAAGRLGVDAICMSTHGHSGLSRVLLGSQAQEVLRHARQPVILVPPEHEGGAS